MLFWLCSQSALSAFISLTTHYPLSSLKTDEAILHKSEKWWKMTSCHSRPVPGLFLDSWQRQSKDLYQMQELHFITCYAPEKKNNLRRHSEPNKSPPCYRFHSSLTAGRSERAKWKPCGGIVMETSLHPEPVEATAHTANTCAAATVFLTAICLLVALEYEAIPQRRESGRVCM